MESSRACLPPAHRSLVSLELPFLVTSSWGRAGEETETADAIAQAERAELEAFLPPKSLGPCLLDAATSPHAPTTAPATAAAASTGAGKGGEDVVPGRHRTRATHGRNDGGDAFFVDTDDEDEGAPSQQSRAAPSSPAGRDRGKHASLKRERTENTELPEDEAHHAQSGTSVLADHDADITSSAPLTLGLDVANPQAYVSAPIYDAWLPTDWSVPGQANVTNGTGTENLTSTADMEEDGHIAFAEQRRREVFPSMVPQLLMEGYYRNDVLLRVERRKRVRRLRDATSGRILSEEEIPFSDDEESQSRTTSTETDRAVPPHEPRVEVVGVVSRHVRLARPADFAFSLFTKAQVEAAPQCCSADVFPPKRFLSSRAPYQVGYTMGAEVNTSVQAHERRLREGDTAKPPGEDEPAGEDSEAPFTTLMSSLTVDASTDALPPPPTLRQKSYLAYIGCSPAVVAAAVSSSSHDGQKREEDGPTEDAEEADAAPAEVRVLSALLASRPVWLTRELNKAMAGSGLCPRLFTNKQVVMCMTYAIRNGPFNRLRIRMGYNPYASSVLSVAYQRLAVRLFRRSELGVQVRDLARSPHIAEAVRQLLEKHAPRAIAARKRTAEEQQRLRAEGNASAAGSVRADCFGTLVETLCNVVSQGALNVGCQFVDLLDDEVYRELVERVEAATEMPLSARGCREGWLSPQAYQRALSHFTDALARFVHDEVVPMVRSLRDHGAPGTTGATADIGSDPDEGSEDDEDEDSEDTASSLSAAAAASSSAASSLASPSVSSSDSARASDEEDEEPQDDNGNAA